MGGQNRDSDMPLFWNDSSLLIIIPVNTNNNLCSTANIHDALQNVTKSDTFPALQTFQCKGQVVPFSFGGVQSCKD